MDKFILEVFINEKKIYCKIYNIINICMCDFELLFNCYIYKSIIKIINKIERNIYGSNTWKISRIL